MDDNYYEKYLKYKSKYLDLKEQIGGKYPSTISCEINVYKDEEKVLKHTNKYSHSKNFKKDKKELQLFEKDIVKLLKNNEYNNCDDITNKKSLICEFIKKITNKKRTFIFRNKEDYIKDLKRTVESYIINSPTQAGLNFTYPYEIYNNDFVVPTTSRKIHEQIEVHKRDLLIQIYNFFIDLKYNNNEYLYFTPKIYLDDKELDEIQSLENNKHNEKIDEIINNTSGDNSFNKRLFLIVYKYILRFNNNGILKPDPIPLPKPSYEW